jgi:DNA-binding MarR family transcriptional regulator
MAKVEPLTPAEEQLWRALIRIVITLPRQLEVDIVRATGLTSTEYITLMSLSEAPNRELRMADLASATGLSASRVTRVVDDLQSRRLVVKSRSVSDGRGNVATLTREGFAKLKAAYPEHLASVRRRVLDHIDSEAVTKVTQALTGVAAQLQDKPNGS